MTDMASRIPTARRFDLDWVRIIAFLLLIFYHVGMLYVSWGFHVKSTHRITALEPLMLVLNPWRLTLLFLISGAATRFMWDGRSAAVLAGRRVQRLLPPLIFGMLVIVAPQSYLQAIEQKGYTGDFPTFYWQQYLAFSRQFCDRGCVILPTYNHLWFVFYLLAFTLLLCALIALAPAAIGRLERAWLRLGSAGVLIVPAATLALLRFLLVRRYPETYS